MKFDLRHVLFVPARLAPHKDHAPIDARHRVAMLALAIAGRPDWSIDLEELDREPPSWTIDTLRSIAGRRRGDEIWLLMGTDVLAGFGRWKQPEEILKIARIAAFHREPFVGPGLRVPELPGLANRLTVFDAGSVRISATELRNDLAAGRSVAGRIPSPVAEYITKHGLYRSEAAPR
jgi:nicotinate-nucleotide adenylyltransferase